MSMSELRRFALPDVGEGLVEAEIVRWHVRPGEPVRVNQIILEIETAKAVVELPCPFAGVVGELLVEEGTTVEVGTALITVAVGGDAPRVAPPVASREQERVPVLVGYGAMPGATSRRPRRRTAPERPGRSERPGGSGDGGAGEPTVRRLAKDLGVDLAALARTGPGGSVTHEDVRRAAAVPDPEPGGGQERIPVRGVRRRTAEAMVRSAFTAPHVTTWLQVDVTAMTELVTRLRGLADFAGTRVSPLLPVARALVIAVRRNPMINSSWDEAAQEIALWRRVNLGVAVATERGLIVPNVKGADDLSLPALARALTELTETARAGGTTPGDLSGGTVTITNTGVFRVDAGTPILPPGESAILALGQIRDMPWVHEGRVTVRRVATLALSFDHRIVDGELGATVLREIGAMLEDPLLMLAWS
ncbi:dihydrolipoamide acetyltransferase family protein [Streptosporangium sp. NPDC020145]|uniref:dihydrolipoamide acetyltransferase family protein n=1 Tax=Streptosporangium sp. NPDC020145 TaxID=3154694 RepID=UPI00341DAAFD